MCNGANYDVGKSERERLEEALNRDSVKQHQWCEDGKTIIEAARKYLETLPKPKRKVKITATAIITDGKYVGVVHPSCFPGIPYANQQHVELTGEYEV